MKQSQGRMMITAVGSGSGKTLFTCGLLRALKNRNEEVVSYKCGPDYIDPMFHRRVLDMPSYNLDSFFATKEVMTYLFQKETNYGKKLAVIEGVMGYYDGLGGNTTIGSAYEVAKQLEVPVFLLINARGMSTSVAAMIQGFIGYRQPNYLAGIILNQVSPSYYPKLKQFIEEETGLPVVGYLPKLEDVKIESRHLGLIAPQEVKEFDQLFDKVASQIQASIDIDQMLDLARRAPELSNKEGTQSPWNKLKNHQVKIAVAHDEAFSFHYEDNEWLLEELGATIVPFSPIRDPHLPQGVDGLILNGGYPELYARELEENSSMRQDILKCYENKMPIIAECGGFLYLKEELLDEKGRAYQMVGALEGSSYKTHKLQRFGYQELISSKDTMLLREGETLRCHEFHYYDTQCNGRDYIAQKASTGAQWASSYASKTLYAGFAHLYYCSKPEIASRFIDACALYKERK